MIKTHLMSKAQVVMALFFHRLRVLWLSFIGGVSAWLSLACFGRGVSRGLFTVIVASSMLSLNGCGFHLRGLDTVGQTQFKSVQLQNVAGVRPEVLQAIRSQMALSGVTVVDSMAAAELQLVFQPTIYSASRTAYSGQGDTTAELLKMSQPFTALWVATDESFMSTQVHSYRDRQIDTAAILAANRELGAIHREMAEGLARQLMDRINRALLKRSARPTPEAKASHVAPAN